MYLHIFELRRRRFFVCPHVFPNPPKPLCPAACCAPAWGLDRPNGTTQTAFAESGEPRAGPAAVENCPLQMVSTGNAEDDYSFKLCEDNLDRVLSKVLFSDTIRAPPKTAGVVV